MSKRIITVTGEIAPEELGITSMHDHVFVDYEYADPSREGTYLDHYAPRVLEQLGGEVPFELGEISLRNIRLLQAGALVLDPSYWEWSDPEIIREELELYAKAGGDCLVSVSPKSLNRRAGEMRRLSEETGVKIVAATGFYAHEMWAPEYFDWDVDDMLRFILDEVEHGLDDTDVKPGVIKAAANELDEPTVRALTACARAQAETGLCLHVHNGVEFSRDDSWRMLELVLEAGADPQKVVWGHSQNLVGDRDVATILGNPDSFTPDVGFLTKVADQGVTISIDCIGMVTSFELLGFIDMPEIDQAIIVAKLIKEGYADRLVVGHDACFKLCATRYGGTGFTRIPTWLLPNLRAAGYPPEEIDRVAIGNPARLLSV